MIKPHTHDCQICSARYRASDSTGWLSLRTDGGYLYSACSRWCWQELKRRNGGLRQELATKQQDGGFW